jgi:hypothetical protein
MVTREQRELEIEEKLTKLAKMEREIVEEQRRVIAMRLKAVDPAARVSAAICSRQTKIEAIPPRSRASRTCKVTTLAVVSYVVVFRL